MKAQNNTLLYWILKTNYVSYQLLWSYLKLYRSTVQVYQFGTSCRFEQTDVSCKSMQAWSLTHVSHCKINSSTLLHSQNDCLRQNGHVLPANCWRSNHDVLTSRFCFCVAGSSLYSVLHDFRFQFCYASSACKQENFDKQVVRLFSRTGDVCQCIPGISFTEDICCIIVAIL